MNERPTPRRSSTGILRPPARVSGSLTANSVGRQFSDSANSQLETANGTVGPIPAYTVWDLNLDYEIKEDLSAFVGVKNLFDKGYFTTRESQKTGIVPAPEQSFQVGLSAKF